MKKIFSLILLYFFFISNTFAGYGDIFYVNTDNLNVRSDSTLISSSVAKMHKGYIVMDLGDDENNFKKVRLTDGKIGYIKNTHLSLHNGNPYEINANFGEVNVDKIYLKKEPYVESENVATLHYNDKVTFLHVNLINNRFARIFILSGENKGKIGYLGIKYLNVYNFNLNKKQTFNFIMNKSISNKLTVNNSNLTNTNSSLKVLELVRKIKNNGGSNYEKYNKKLAELKYFDNSKYKKIITVYEKYAPDLLPSNQNIGVDSSTSKNNTKTTDTNIINSNLTDRNTNSSYNPNTSIIGSRNSNTSTNSSNNYNNSNNGDYSSNTSNTSTNSSNNYNNSNNGDYSYNNSNTNTNSSNNYNTGDYSSNNPGTNNDTSNNDNNGYNSGNDSSILDGTYDSGYDYIDEYTEEDKSRDEAISDFESVDIVDLEVDLNDLDIEEELSNVNLDNISIEDVDFEEILGNDNGETDELFFLEDILINVSELDVSTQTNPTDTQTIDTTDSTNLTNDLGGLGEVLSEGDDDTSLDFLNNLDFSGIE